MASKAGVYFPIRPDGYRPAPVPYWQELNNAQALIGIGTGGLLSQVPSMINNSDSLLSDSNINKAIISTPLGAELAPDLPEEIDLEEWKRRNIHSTPIYEPNIDDYTTGGEIPIFNLPQHTGGAVPEIEIPTNTGFPSTPIELPNILTIDNKSKIEGGLLEEETSDFYSRVTKAIENSKTNKASPDQWKGMINNAGVNQDELNWLGLDEFFKDKKSVTKDELLEYTIDNDLADNVAITILGEEPFSKEMKRRSEIQYLMDEIMKTPIPDRTAEQIDTLNKFKEEHYNLSKEIRNVNWRRTEYQSAELSTGSDYEDYREMIFQLPNANDKAYSKAEKEFIEYRNALEEKYDKVYPNQIEQQMIIKEKKLGTPEELKKYQELQQTYLDLREELEGKVFKGTHYKEDKNVFAHARFNTRDIDGKKTLFIEELQSDWVHKGKNQGFIEGQTDLQIRHQEIIEELNQEKFESITNATDEQDYKKLNKEFQKVSDLLEAENELTTSKVPNLPFKKNWQDVVLKKLIKYASENGFDAIAMTGGDIQKERYNLSNHIDYLTIRDEGTVKGKQQISIDAGNKQEGDLHKGDIYDLDELQNLVGKEMADKIINSEQWKTKNRWDGNELDLNVGGEGLGEMYDKVFSKSLKKLGNKFNTNVEIKEIFNVNKRIQREVMEAQNIEQHYNAYMDWATNEKGISEDDLESISGSDDEMQLWIEFLQQDNDGYRDDIENKGFQNFYYMELSPSLKDKAIESGFPIAKLKQPQSPLLV